MTPNELLTAANEARPDLMEKVAKVVKVLSATDPETAEEIMEDIRYITGHTMDKMASVDLARFGLAVGGSILAGVGSAVAGDLYDSARRGMTKNRNYSRMIAVNPALGKDPQAKTLFNIVHRYAPDFTADPTLAASMINQMSKLPGSEIEVIHKALASRKNLMDAKDKQFRPGGQNFTLEDVEGARERAQIRAEQRRHHSDLAKELRNEINDAHGEARAINSKIDDVLTPSTNGGSIMQRTMRLASNRPPSKP